MDKIIHIFYLIGFVCDFSLWTESLFEHNHQFSNLK